MVPVAEALERVKGQYKQLLTGQSILDVCDKIGHAFRQRQLGPVNTVYLFLLQVLYGNTAISHLVHLAGFAFTGSAYCQARQQLPLELLRELFAVVLAALRRANQKVGSWHGHRVFHIDGSGFSTPDTDELRQHFGQPGRQAAGCGFPVAHLLAMFDAATGLVLDLLAAPLRTHDLAGAYLFHPMLAAGDVLIGDRGFCSYVHLALLIGRNLHGLFRVHQRVIVNFLAGRRYHKICRGPWKRKGLPRSRWVKKLGCCDQLVEWFKPESCPQWMDPAAYRALPDSLILREFRYRIGRPGFRVRVLTAVTTLLDPVRYPVEELADLYFARWQIETNFKHLKITLGLDVLKCQSVDGVLKELMMFGLVYNLVRAVMLRAAEDEQVPPERISFIDALRWLRQALWTDVPLKLVVNPRRPGRFHPRVRKRRPKAYPLMTKPRRKLLQELEGKRLGA